MSCNFLLWHLVINSRNYLPFAYSRSHNFPIVLQIACGNPEETGISLTVWMEWYVCFVLYGEGGVDNSPYTVPVHVIPFWTEEMWNNRMRSKRKVLTWWLLLLLVEGSLSIILACCSLRNNGSARLYLVFMEGYYKFISASLERLFVILYIRFFIAANSSYIQSSLL